MKKRKLHLHILVVFIITSLYGCTPDNNTEETVIPANTTKIARIELTRTDSQEIEETYDFEYQNNKLQKMTLNEYISNTVVSFESNYIYTGDILTQINNAPVSYDGNTLTITAEDEQEILFFNDNMQIEKIELYYRYATTLELDAIFYFTYDAAGNIIRNDTHNANDELLWYAIFEYDSKQNPLQNLQYPIKQLLYNEFFGGNENNPISRKEFNNNGELQEEFIYEYQYNADDFPVEMKITYTNPLGTFISYEYFTYEE